MRKLQTRAAIAATIALFGILTACSSGSDTPPTTTRATGSQVATPEQVTVTVTEFGITSSTTSFRQGVGYHFVVTNNGAAPHELMVMQPMAAGMMSMSEMDELAVAVVEEDDLGAGATYEFDHTFGEAYPDGSLEFACHIPGHYELGMHTAMTVQ